jgi:hypothetical protein
MPAIDSSTPVPPPANVLRHATASAVHPLAHPPIRPDMHGAVASAVARRLLIVDENWW